MKNVIFDFDGTLTMRDTLRPLAHYLAQTENKTRELSVLYVYLILFKLKLVDDKRMKQKFLDLFLKNKTVHAAQSIIEKFWREKMPALIHRPTFDKLREHVLAGDNVYLVSANFDFVLAPAITKWRLRGLLCTDTETLNDHFTGKIRGLTCRGSHKVTRVTDHFGVDSLKYVLAYGDNEDCQLLQAVGQGININKNETAI